MKLRSAVLLLLAWVVVGCATQGEGDPHTQASESIGKATGEATENAVKAVFEFLPGLKPAYNGVSRQLGKIGDMRAKRKADKAGKQTDSLRLQFCFANPCTSICPELLEDALGIVTECPDLISPTSYIQEKVTPAQVQEDTEDDGTRLLMRRPSLLEQEGLQDTSDAEGFSEIDCNDPPQDKTIDRPLEADARAFAGFAWDQMSTKQRSAYIDLFKTYGSLMDSQTEFQNHVLKGDWEHAAKAFTDSVLVTCYSPKQARNLAEMIRGY